MSDHLDALLSRAATCGDPVIERKAHVLRAALAELAGDLIRLRRVRSTLRLRASLAAKAKP